MNAFIDTRPTPSPESDRLAFVALCDRLGTRPEYLRAALRHFIRCEQEGQEPYTPAAPHDEPPESEDGLEGACWCHDSQVCPSTMDDLHLDAHIRAPGGFGSGRTVVDL